MLWHEDYQKTIKRIDRCYELLNDKNLTQYEKWYVESEMHRAENHLEGLLVDLPY